MFKSSFIKAARKITSFADPLQAISLLDTIERLYFHRSDYAVKTCVKRKIITLPQARSLNLFIECSNNDMYDETNINPSQKKYTRAVAIARSVMIASDYYNNDEIPSKGASILEVPEQADLNLISALEILLTKDLYHNHVVPIAKRIIEGNYEHPMQIYVLLSEYPLSYSELEDAECFPLLDYNISLLEPCFYESYEDWSDRVLQRRQTAALNNRKWQIHL